MRIVVNTRLLRKDKMDGIGWFKYNTLKSIVANNPTVDFHFLFDSGVEKEFLFGENVTGHNLFPPAKHALLNIAWSEISVKRKLTQLKPDLYFSPDGMLCLGWSGKQHAVIHDVNFMHYPEHLKYTNRLYYKHYFPKFAAKASRIATVSEYSKNDICESFNINTSKVDVVYCGINTFFKPLSEEQKKITKSKYSSGFPYFLFVGTLSPRKNILGLLKAFELLRSNNIELFKLIIVGGEMYGARQMHEFHASMQFKDDVIFTGRLPNEELNDVVGAALCLTYVPFFEGFGIPLIEAMKCEIPIISSNVTSMPEVTGGAGLLVDPENSSEIAEAMHRICYDSSLREHLIKEGKIQKEKFSWEKTSVKLWQSILWAL